MKVKDPRHTNWQKPTYKGFAYQGFLPGSNHNTHLFNINSRAALQNYNLGFALVFFFFFMYKAIAEKVKYFTFSQKRIY